jgi:hypothetical protein
MNHLLAAQPLRLGSQPARPFAIFGSGNAGEIAKVGGAPSPNNLLQILGFCAILFLMVDVKTWPIWRQVVGPQLNETSFHFATISDRDPDTGQSFVENMEARNRQALVAARKAPKTCLP